MSRRTNSTPRLLTSAALVVGLSLSWSLPSVAFAAPPQLPPEQPVQPAPAADPVPVQPAAAPQPQPQPQPGWEQPAAQPQPQPQPQPTIAPQPQPQPQPYGQPPPPTYQPMPQPLPPKGPNPNRGMGLAIAGFTIFGVTYLFTAVGATAMIDSGAPETGRPLLIPVVGPFIAATKQSYATVGFGLAFTGVIQLASLGMGIGGAVMLGNARRQAKLSATGSGLQLQF